MLGSIEKEIRSVRSLHLFTKFNKLNPTEKSTSHFSVHQSRSSLNSYSLFGMQEESKHSFSLHRNEDNCQPQRRERKTDNIHRNQFSFWKKKSGEVQFVNNTNHKRLEHCFLELLEKNSKQAKSQRAIDNVIKNKKNNGFKQLREVEKQENPHLRIKRSELDRVKPNKENFTIPLKELRNKNKGSSKVSPMNCRVVNIFSAIQDEIKPIHQNQSTSLMLKLLQAKDQNSKRMPSGERQKIQQSCISEKKEEEKCIHIGKVQWYITKMNLTEHRTLKKGPRRLINEGYDHEYEEQHKQRGPRNTKKSLFKMEGSKESDIQLKPWSTREILLEG